MVTLGLKFDAGKPGNNTGVPLPSSSHRRGGNPRIESLWGKRVYS